MGYWMLAGSCKDIVRIKVGFQLTLPDSGLRYRCMASMFDCFMAQLLAIPAVDN